jgi:hypothetical protein
MKNAFMLVVILFLSSFCNKDNKPVDNESETHLLLVEGDWVHKSYLTDDNDDGVFEDTALPCQINDVWRFETDNSFQWRDELEYCDPDVDTVAIIKGTWELRNNDTEVFVSIAGGLETFNFQIHEINSTQLELRQFNDPSTFAPAEERFTFAR